MTADLAKNSRKPIRRRRWLRRLLWIGAPLLLFPPLAWLAFIAAVEFLPYPSSLDRPPKSGTWIEDRRGAPLAAFVADDGQWRLPLEYHQISSHLLDAIIAVEDSSFYQHSGVNWKSAAGAAWQNLKAMRIKRGASTITMQVERLRDSGPHSFLYKIEQAVRAKQLEKRLTKREIIVEYVNRAPFGGNLVGAGAASWRYFGRPCRELSLGQAALLAGLPKNPTRYRPDLFPDRARQRRDGVLARMAELGMIRECQRAEASAEPLDAKWRPLPQTASSPDLPAANGALPTLLSIAHGDPGKSIRCTIDASIQRLAAEAASQHLGQLEPSGATAAAVVVLDNETGQCLAAVSLSRDRPKVDLTRAARSTGSTLKPFIYATAFDMGIASPQTMLRDSPMSWPGYMPANYDRGFRGSILAADALAESRNIPALLLLGEVGVERGATIMGACGLRTLTRSPQRYGLSLAIGGAEATPMELAEAYATLARGGVCLPAKLTFAPADFSVVSSPPPALRPLSPPPVLRPLSPPPVLRGRVRVGADGADGADVATAPAISPRACFQALACIASPDRTAAICPDAARMNVAWKTGTSSGHRDAWCAAVTRQRTVVVWMGNASGRGARCLVGQEAAAPLALRIIAALGGENAPWPGQVDAQPAAPKLAELPAARSLALLSPIDGMDIVYNSELPADRQQLLLRAAPAQQHSISTDVDKLWWFIDGRPVGTTSADEKLFWPPARGRHEIRVTDEQGHYAVARIHVR